MIFHLLAKGNKNCDSCSGIWIAFLYALGLTIVTLSHSATPMPIDTTFCRYLPIPLLETSWILCKKKRGFVLFLFWQRCSTDRVRKVKLWFGLSLAIDVFNAILCNINWIMRLDNYGEHLNHYIYCRVPAGWGLQQTTQVPGSDKTRGQGSFGPFTGGLNLILPKRNGSYAGPVLLRQGDPGTSQYVMYM